MAARSGMTDIIQTVRDLSATGTADYTVGATTYWTDNQIQDALDQNRTDVYVLSVSPVRETDSGGTARYYDYHIGAQYIEQTTGGTSIFFIQETDGTYIGTASYTMDYKRGVATFGSDTTGSALLFSFRSYDPYAAAADIWDMKAAHVADRFDFTADGASFKVSQLVDHYRQRAGEQRTASTTGGVSEHTFVRGDLNLSGW